MRLRDGQAAAQDQSRALEIVDRFLVGPLHELGARAGVCELMLLKRVFGGCLLLLRSGFARQSDRRLVSWRRSGLITSELQCAAVVRVEGIVEEWNGLVSGRESAKRKRWFALACVTSSGVIRYGRYAIEFNSIQSNIGVRLFVRIRHFRIGWVGYVSSW